MNTLRPRNRAVANFLLLAMLFPAFAKGQSLIQINAKLPSSGAQVSAVYASAQGAGDLNVVVVGWSDSTATVSTVTDTKGNVYTLAVGPTVVPGAVSQSIYYAKNIAGATAGGNTVTVKFSTTASYPDVRILEYSGLDVNNPLDGGMGAVGSATTSDSGALVTTNSNDLLVGANTVLTSTTAAGAGYTNRMITDPDGDLVEDRVVTAVGSYHATAALSSGGSWVMEVVAFKAAGAAPAPTAPGGLVASPVSSAQINLTWTASTETGGTVSSYLVERCVGAGCTNFVQVGTTGATSYSDAGLASGTSYSYRVRGQDTANSVGPYSNTATGITQGTAVPTAPGNLTGVAGASGPVVVATQGYINATSQPTHTTNAFDSSGGDLLVICVSSHGGVTITPTDSYGNSWVDASGPTSTTVGFDLRTGVWYARNATVGTGHTVTVNLSAAQPVVISVFVVKGSNIATPIDAVSAIGSDGGTQTTSVSSPSITTTTGYDLLIGFAKSSINEVWTAGAGYTEQAVASSAYLNAETGQGVTPGSYAATFGINGAATWQSAVVAVSPSAAAASPNQVNLAWSASTETGGTIGMYLVERCQGAGCTSFTQIGTSATTTFNDTTVSSATTYIYRVRAIDTFNDVGAYSNTTTITMP